MLVAMSSDLLKDFISVLVQSSRRAVIIVVRMLCRAMHSCYVNLMASEYFGTTIVRCDVISDGLCIDMGGNQHKKASEF